MFVGTDIRTKYRKIAVQIDNGEVLYNSGTRQVWIGTNFVTYLTTYLENIVKQMARQQHGG